MGTALWVMENLKAELDAAKRELAALRAAAAARAGSQGEAEMVPEPSPFNEGIEAFFKRLDRNSDGVVSRDEFRDAMRRRGATLQLRRALRAAGRPWSEVFVEITQSTSHHSTISLEQFKAAVLKATAESQLATEQGQDIPKPSPLNSPTDKIPASQGFDVRESALQGAAASEVPMVDLSEADQAAEAERVSKMIRVPSLNLNPNPD